MNEILIDAKNRLSKKYMQDFLSKINIEQDVLFEYNGLLLYLSTEKLKEIFIDESIINELQDDSKYITISQNNIKLIFTIYDFNSFKNNEKKIKQLFSKTKSKIKIDDITFNIAVCNIKSIDNEDSICDITAFNGNKKQIIEFMNNEYHKRLLKNKLIDNIKFNICYTTEEELMNEDNWFTLNELSNGKIITLEEK